MESLYEIEMDVKFLIEQLSEHYIPSLKSTLSTLKIILVKAKKRRLKFLAWKTTATTAGACGAVSMIAGIILIPSTLGASTTLINVGLSLYSYRAITGVSTSIADYVIQKKDVKKVEKNLCQLYAVKERLDDEFDKCIRIKEWLKKEMGYNQTKEATIILGPEDFNTADKLIRGCKIENLYFDKEITVNDIRAGDHIMRKLNGSPVGYHHGVALGKDEQGVEEVAEFGRKGKQEKTSHTYTCHIIDFNAFLGEHKRLYKRHYIGYELELEETLALAKQICSGDCQSTGTDWDTYDLFGNNCEHFATYLKLKTPWSGQISKPKKFMKNAMKKLPLATARLTVRTVQTTNKSQVVAKLVAAQAPKVMSVGFSIGVGIETIFTATDIALLIYDWRRKRPNIEKLETSIKILQQELATYESYLSHLHYAEKVISLDVGRRRKYKRLARKGK